MGENSRFGSQKTPETRFSGVTSLKISLLACF
jgi:hypothetical protein